MDADDVGLPQQVFLASRVFDARGLRPLRGDVLAPGHDLHAERPADLGDAQAELAEPDNAEVEAFDIEADHALPQRAALEAGVL